MFFTPIVRFQMESYTGKTVWFTPGTLYPKTILAQFPMSFGIGSHSAYDIDAGIKFLSTQWIKIVEPTDIHELIKSVLLTQKGE